MTPAELADQWAAALDGVTLGEWVVWLDAGYRKIVGESGDGPCVANVGRIGWGDDADARFIAHARNLVAELATPSACARRSYGNEAP